MFFIRYSKWLSMLLLFCLIFIRTEAQPIPVSDGIMQEYLRMKQLNGQIDSTLSLNVRPVLSSYLISGVDSSELRYIPKDLIGSSDVFEFKLFPISLIQQYNSHHPYGWNDGLMIPAKGYQLNISGGFFAKLGPLSIQLRPELSFAANPEYLDQDDLIASGRYSNYLSASYGADIPAYYEGRNYTSLGFGQSSVRLNIGPASLGFSNESLWWGPGRKNSLLMSNSARGFKHITLNTSRPVTTLIGSLEGQIISGRLENSNSPLNLLKVQEWRYLSGMILSYQPRWVPGLFMGLTRVFQMYHTDVKGAADYFPLLQPFEKLKTDEDNKNRDQISSVFARMLFSEAGAEVYVEYGRNDHSVDIRDFKMEPDHSRAYLVGFQKLVSLNKPGEKLLLSAEVTQMSQSPNRFVRDAGTFYVHAINQGYTHEGEVLGAGVAPGEIFKPLI